jgi:hypothetical protein
MQISRLLVSMSKKSPWFDHHNTGDWYCRDEFGDPRIKQRRDHALRLERRNLPFSKGLSCGELSSLLHHEAGRGDEVKSCESIGAASVVFGEASGEGRVSGGSLVNSATGQEDEATPGLGQFDDLEGDAMPSCRKGGRFAPDRSRRVGQCRR